MRPAAFLFAFLALAGLPFIAAAQEFVPLTSVPAFQEVTGEGGISGFLNQLYILCVGAAAVIAVIQLVRAGMLYSLGDSFTEKKEAKNLILVSLLGLLLVLSPTIVFGIINPAILELRVDVVGLGGDTQAPSSPSDGNYGFLSLQANKWGALDDQCDFSPDIAWFQAFKVAAAPSVQTLGKGNAARGRECCAAASGSIEMSFSGEFQLEQCNLSNLFGNSNEGGRYVAKINARGSVNSHEGPADWDMEIYSSGAGHNESGVWYGDSDTIAIHGFRTEQACTSFINGLTPDSLLRIFNERQTGPGGVGLLEGNRGALLANEAGIKLPPGSILSIYTINSKSCDHITYLAK